MNFFHQFLTNFLSIFISLLNFWEFHIKFFLIMLFSPCPKLSEPQKTFKINLQKFNYSNWVKFSSSKYVAQNQYQVNYDREFLYSSINPASFPIKLYTWNVPFTHISNIFSIFFISIKKNLFECCCVPLPIFYRIVIQKSHHLTHPLL